MNNVINLFSRSKAEDKASVGAQNTAAKSETGSAVENQKQIDFETIAQRNAAVRERLMKERNDANKSVLKSYRIK